MMDLYTADTPNGQKISIALEELKIPYQIYHIRLENEERLLEKILPMNPHGLLPVMVDRDKGLTLFESGTILIYLAEKTGRLLPENERKRIDVFQWLLVQNGPLSFYLGELEHFKYYAKDHPGYAIKRFYEETQKLFQVMDRQLTIHPFLAGPEYSMADVATMPWVHGAFHHLEVRAEDFPHVQEWYEVLLKRPAVLAGLRAPACPNWPYQPQYPQ